MNVIHINIASCTKVHLHVLLYTVYNFLMEKGGFEYDEKTEKVKVNFRKAYTAFEELGNLVLMIQAKGDYKAAQELIKKYVVISPSMKTLIDKLSVLPVEIKPIYEIEQMYK